MATREESQDLGGSTEIEAELIAKTEQLKIDGRVVLTEAQEEQIIAETLQENRITINAGDHKKLKYFTIKTEALFKCPKCAKTWSSHMATIVVNLYECKVDKKDCEQACKKCRDGWITPKLTKDRFKEAIDRVIAKYWERKSQDDDDYSPVDNNRRRGNPRAPHEQSLCRRCVKLGRPCW